MVIDSKLKLHPMIYEFYMSLSLNFYWPITLLHLLIE